jgi:ribokinase
MADVVVLGQVGRDLVLTLEALPDAGGSAPATGRRELLGGKGANQAVALGQLGVRVALVGVVADDDAGAQVLAQATADDVDVSCVGTRSGAPTALLLDLVEPDGRRRLVEHVPEEMLLTPTDVAAAGLVIAGCRALVLQLQQPGESVRAALAHASAGALVVADGAPADDATRTALLERAGVLRADAAEAGRLLGRELSGLEQTRAAATDLLAAGPRLVALAVEGEGDLVSWRAGPALPEEAACGWDDGEVLVPLLGDAPVDVTGAGDAYVATLTAALLGGAAPVAAAWAASAAMALTVGHPGGRPALGWERLREVVRRERAT